jgi:hypothetical protein
MTWWAEALSARQLPQRPPPAPIARQEPPAPPAPAEEREVTQDPIDYKGMSVATYAALRGDLNLTQADDDTAWTQARRPETGSDFAMVPDPSGRSWDTNSRRISRDGLFSREAQADAKKAIAAHEFDLAGKGKGALGQSMSADDYASLIRAGQFDQSRGQLTGRDSYFFTGQ